MKREGLKKRIPFLVALLFALMVVSPIVWTGETAEAAEKIRLSMGGATTGTWIYMFCVVLSETWMKYIPDLDITVRATAGTTANYLPMSKGEMDLAGASDSGDYWAIHGMYFTKVKITNFCSLMPATKSFTMAVAPADSPINSWKDFDGKKVAIGARGSPTSTHQEVACQALGVKPKFVFSTPQEAIEMMKDRRVDAMLYSTGIPWSGVMDIAASQKVKLIPMTQEEQKKIHSVAPYRVPDTIPARTYSFQNEDVPTNAGFQTINVRPGLPDDLVYKLCKVIWDHREEVLKASAAFKWVKPADMVHMVAPIHPGAAKYYREIGVLIPDQQIWKKK